MDVVDAPTPLCSAATMTPVRQRHLPARLAAYVISNAIKSKQPTHKAPSTPADGARASACLKEPTKTPAAGSITQHVSMVPATPGKASKILTPGSMKRCEMDRSLIEDLPCKRQRRTPVFLTAYDLMPSASKTPPQLQWPQSQQPGRTLLQPKHETARELQKQTKARRQKSSCIRRTKYKQQQQGSMAHMSPVHGSKPSCGQICPTGGLKPCSPLSSSHCLKDKVIHNHQQEEPPEVLTPRPYHHKQLQPVTPTTPLKLNKSAMWRASDIKRQGQHVPAQPVAPTHGPSNNTNLPGGVQDCNLPIAADTQQEQHQPLPQQQQQQQQQPQEPQLPQQERKAGSSLLSTKIRIRIPAFKPKASVGMSGLVVNNQLSSSQQATQPVDNPNQVLLAAVAPHIAGCAPCNSQHSARADCGKKRKKAHAAPLPKQDSSLLQQQTGDASPLPNQGITRHHRSSKGADHNHKQTATTTLIARHRRAAAMLLVAPMELGTANTAMQPPEPLTLHGKRQRKPSVRQLHADESWPLSQRHVKQEATSPEHALVANRRQLRANRHASTRLVDLGYVSANEDDKQSLAETGINGASVDLLGDCGVQVCTSKQGEMHDQIDKKKKKRRASWQPVKAEEADEPSVMAVAAMAPADCQHVATADDQNRHLLQEGNEELFTLGATGMGLDTLKGATWRTSNHARNCKSQVLVGSHATKPKSSKRQRHASRHLPFGTQLTAANDAAADANAAAGVCDFLSHDNSKVTQMALPTGQSAPLHKLKGKDQRGQRQGLRSRARKKVKHASDTNDSAQHDGIEQVVMYAAHESNRPNAKLDSLCSTAVQTVVHVSARGQGRGCGENRGRGRGRGSLPHDRKLKKSSRATYPLVRVTLKVANEQVTLQLLIIAATKRTAASSAARPLGVRAGGVVAVRGSCATRGRGRGKHLGCNMQSSLRYLQKLARAYHADAVRKEDSAEAVGAGLQQHPLPELVDGTKAVAAPSASGVQKQEVADLQQLPLLLRLLCVPLAVIIKPARLGQAPPIRRHQGVQDAVTAQAVGQHSICHPDAWHAASANLLADRTGKRASMDCQQWKETAVAVLKGLVAALQAGPATAPQYHQERSTASISYVIPTESQQQDVAHLYERLPHVFIRPPNLQPFTPSTVSAVMELLKSSSVAVALLPAKQDGLIKKYLLQPKQRHQLLQQAGCRSCEIQGLQDLKSLMSDQLFICLHYQYTDGQLKPCKLQPTSSANCNSNAPPHMQSIQQDSEHRSNQFQQQQQQRPTLATPNPMPAQLVQIRIVPCCTAADQSAMLCKAVHLSLKMLCNTKNPCLHPEHCDCPQSNHQRVSHQSDHLEKHADCQVITECECAAPSKQTAQTHPVTGHEHRACTGSTAPGVEASNVQIGILIRRGVGGTCPYRAAARKLLAHGWLDVLLNTVPTKANHDEGSNAPNSSTQEGVPTTQEQKQPTQQQHPQQQQGGSSSMQAGSAAPGSPAEQRSKDVPAAPLEGHLLVVPPGNAAAGTCPPSVTAAAEQPAAAVEQPAAAVEQPAAAGQAAACKLTIHVPVAESSQRTEEDHQSQPCTDSAQTFEPSNQTTIRCTIQATPTDGLSECTPCLMNGNASANTRSKADSREHQEHMRERPTDDVHDKTTQQKPTPDNAVHAAASGTQADQPDNVVSSTCKWVSHMVSATSDCCTPLLPVKQASCHASIPNEGGAEATVASDKQAATTHFRAATLVPRLMSSTTEQAGHHGHPASVVRLSNEAYATSVAAYLYSWHRHLEQQQPLQPQRAGLKRGRPPGLCRIACTPARRLQANSQHKALTLHGTRQAHHESHSSEHCAQQQQQLTVAQHPSKEEGLQLHGAAAEQQQLEQQQPQHNQQMQPAPLMPTMKSDQASHVQLGSSHEPRNVTMEDVLPALDMGFTNLAKDRAPAHAAVGFRGLAPNADVDISDVAPNDLGIGGLAAHTDVGISTCATNSDVGITDVSKDSDVNTNADVGANHPPIIASTDVPAPLAVPDPNTADSDVGADVANLLQHLSSSSCADADMDADDQDGVEDLITEMSKILPAPCST
eukprot:jgi/Chrzof1/5539/Cz16g06240.t1